ncbi:LysM domain-containing protein [Lactobacillus sp.]|uniref:LysM peptidoglycan-binding domain-containing protein n=1 Tax=Lactobacillus sp. TaxID=1591 RepID=UPI00198D51CD|nr:LysM domain-containing protein [Lactobacillus sp.]MBD5429184.1 LysM peptidoglycan-binding domain-containing protein [Lactobacillus sp.]
MSKKPQEKGPYKHYERPTTSRSQRYAREERKDKKGHPQIWAGIIIVAIILIAAVPILGAKLHNNQSQNIAEKSVQPAETSKSTSKSKKTTKKKKSKKSLTQSSSSIDTSQSSSSSQSQEVDTQESSTTDQSQSSSSTSSNSSSDSDYKADSNGNYTIQEGDTLSEIAKANNTTVDELMKINGISKQNNVVIGQTIKVTDDDNSSSNDEN